jgi:hypothetical protein
VRKWLIAILLGLGGLAGFAMTLCGVAVAVTGLKGWAGPGLAVKSRPIKPVRPSTAARRIFNRFFAILPAAPVSGDDQPTIS